MHHDYCKVFILNSVDRGFHATCCARTRQGVFISDAALRKARADAAAAAAASAGTVGARRLLSTVDGATVEADGTLRVPARGVRTMVVALASPTPAAGAAALSTVKQPVVSPPTPLPTPVPTPAPTRQPTPAPTPPLPEPLATAAADTGDAAGGDGASTGGETKGASAVPRVSDEPSLPARDMSRLGYLRRRPVSGDVWGAAPRHVARNVTASPAPVPRDGTRTRAPRHVPTPPLSDGGLVPAGAYGGTASFVARAAAAAALFVCVATVGVRWLRRARRGGVGGKAQ